MSVVPRGAALRALAVLAALAVVRAGNPLVPDIGQADPHLHFWPEINGGTTFAYTTHDASNKNTGFVMYDWRIFSSSDLVTWTLADTLYPNATAAPPSAYSSCWATDAAHKYSPATKSWTYYFYLSIGTCEIGVMVGDGPAGPWTNVLGQPLLNSSYGNSLNPPACFRDPAVFEDDDGSYYLIAGVFDYYIMRLGDDLVSLAEAPRVLSVVNPTGPYGAKTDDKPFLHKYLGVYYLSWGCFYGTATSPYGPFTYVGSAIDTAALALDFRMNDTAGPWYSHQDYADRHGSFWTQNGQWFYASNDRTHSTDTAHRDVFRDTVVGYVHYRNNGSIVPVAIDATGVGAYSAAARALVPAENYMALSSAPGAASKRHLDALGDAAFAVAVALGGPRAAPASVVATFPRVRGAGAGATLRLIALNSGAAPVRVIARRARADGDVVAACAVPPAAGAGAGAGAGALVTVACDGALAPGDADELDLVLTVDAPAAGDADDGAELLIDAFFFEPAPPATAAAAPA